MPIASDPKTRNTGFPLLDDDETAGATALVTSVDVGCSDDDEGGIDKEVEDEKVEVQCLAIVMLSYEMDLFDDPSASSTNGVADVDEVELRRIPVISPQVTSEKTGTLIADPITDLVTFGVQGSHPPAMLTTQSTPKAPAVRIKEPTLPGSATPSSTNIKSGGLLLRL